MEIRKDRIPVVLLALVLIVVLSIAHQAFAQAPGGRGAQPPRSPRDAAPVDLTGYWVSVVTEDWRWRMVTPAKGDFAGVPLNTEGRTLGRTWDPAKDETAGTQCKAYGAPAIMRQPGRLHITWQDENTLRIDTDYGTQTRLFHFGGTRPQGARTDVARLFGCAVGTAAPRRGSAGIHSDRTQSARRAARPVAGSRHDRVTGGIPEKERSPLQCGHRPAGVLRSVQRTERRHLVRRHHDR